MTALLLDEMFSGAIAEQMRARGVEAVAVVEDLTLIEAPDDDLLVHAAGQGRVLVTAKAPTSPRSSPTGVPPAGRMWAPST